MSLNLTHKRFIHTESKRKEKENIHTERRAFIHIHYSSHRSVNSSRVIAVIFLARETTSVSQQTGGRGQKVPLDRSIGVFIITA